jgi:hypothetical protein
MAARKASTAGKAAGAGRASGSSGGSSSGALLHRQVCLGTPPPQWNDRCECGHIASSHDALTHESVGPAGRACTGRSNAGRCHNCDCPRFRGTEATGVDRPVRLAS